MTVTFNANRPVRTEDAGGHGVGGNVKTAIGIYTLSAALSLNQILDMVAVPIGARIVDVILASDGLDAGATLTVDVGDAALPNRFISASAVAQAGGVTRLSEAGGVTFKYTQSDVIKLRVGAAPPPPTGAVTGEIKLVVLYVLD